MSQEINLYEERLHPRREILNGHNLGMATLVALALVAILAAWTQYDAAQAGALADRLKTQASSLQKQVAEQSKAVSEQRVSPPLAAELEKAREALEARQSALGLLDSGRLGSTHGFSGIFAGFSNQALANPNLWLAGFSITQGGGAIEIRGRTLDVADLPAYVHRLGKEPAFRGRHFSGLEMLGHEAGKMGAAGTVTGAASPVVTPRFTEFTLHSEGGSQASAGGRGS